MRNLFAAAVIILAIPHAASANEPAGPGNVQFPGSLNIAVATGEPSEPGNVTSGGTLSQGVSLVRKGPFFLVGFLDVTVRADTEGYEWNNTLPYRAGMKIVHIDSHGVFEAAAGVMADQRERSLAGVHRTAHVSYWRGWRGDALADSHAPGLVAFPGNSYAVTGYLTSREANNWITNATIEQGATVYQRKRVAVTPFLRIAASIDSENRPWNNRSRLDSGLKLTGRVLNGVLDGGVARRLTFNRSVQDATPTTVLFVNFWLGWTPRAIFN